jgi:hypothetical protein
MNNSVTISKRTADSTFDVDVAAEWLEAKRVQLWADWHVASPTARRGAAEWFVKEMRSYLAFRGAL